MDRSLWSLVFLTFFHCNVFGYLLTQDDISTNTTYDFVVIGGGTAGNAVANRLTEDSSVTVLVLEAGPTDAGVLAIQVPFLCGTTSPNTLWDWNYTTVPQPGLNGASISYPRGHVLGGSSSINCLVYTRGAKDDFDRYANYTGDQSWSWDSMLPYFKKSEKFTESADKHNTTGQFDPSVHGFEGLNSVSLPNAPTVIDSRFQAAIQELGGEFRQNIDTNSGNPLGFGWAQAVIDGPTGSRSSSSSGYLAQRFLDRPNLHILVDAQVSRLIQSANSSGKPEFKQVEYRHNGGLQTVFATKEVILSAGAINTPQVLLNSGIGDSSALSDIGIPPLVHLPHVGKHLSDHPIIILSWLVNSTETYDDYKRNQTFQTEALQQWNQTRQGVYANGIAQHIGFARAQNSSSIFANASDPSPGLGAPHFEIFLSNFLLGDTPPEGHYISMSAILLQPGPQARGSVTINSTDPFATPIIDAGLLGDPHTDVPLLREAIKTIWRLASASAWKDYIIRPADPKQPEPGATDEVIDTFIRSATRSAYHVVGTSRIVSNGSTDGVVDPDLRVLGVNGLRIVDAGVLPFVPSGHSQAATYALAERAANRIKESSGLK